MYEDRMDKLVIGIARTIDGKYLYLWYSDGTVSRMPNLRKDQSLSEVINEDVVPAIEWNSRDFKPLATNYGQRS